MNRFFKSTDEKINKVGKFEIPETWWSRPYEYKFAIDFLKEKDRILDVGCGIEHPFKNYASTKVKEVVALDKDEKIKDFEDEKNIKYVHGDILNYKDDEKFDKIFVISTLEHTQTHIIEKLKNMYKLLSDKGRLIITSDSPTLGHSKLLEYAQKARFKLDGKPDYDDKDKAIHSKRYNLYCYSMVFKK